MFSQSPPPLANLKWVVQSDNVKMTEAKVKGFSWLKHRYRVIHDTQNHTLSVIRLRHSNTIGDAVSLDYQPKSPRSHRTRRWIVNLLLTRGAAISDEEKAKILAQPALEAYSVQLLDWMSDDGLNSPLPKFGISCRIEPDGDAHTQKRTQNVFASMLKHQAEQAFIILRQKSTEFQASILTRQPIIYKQYLVERRELFRHLLEQAPQKVQQLLSILITDAKIDPRQITLLTKLVKAFVEADPKLFAEKLKSSDAELLRFVLLLTSEETPSAKLSQFYFEVLEGEQSAHLVDALRTITGFSRNNQEATPYANVCTSSAWEWDTLWEKDKTSLLHRLHSDKSLDCLLAMLKRGCDLPCDWLVGAQMVVFERSVEEQWSIMVSNLNTSKAQSFFYVHLICTLLNKESNPNFSELCELLFAVGSEQYFWSFYVIHGERAEKLLREQSIKAQARCLAYALITKKTSSDEYRFAKSMFQEKGGVADIIKQELYAHKDTLTTMRALIEKEHRVAVQLL